VSSTALLVTGVVTLSAGTYACRLSGRLLRQRVTFPPRAEQLLAVLGHEVGDSRLRGGCPPRAVWRRRVL
jgi:uncharacterized membrane protein